MRAISTDFPEPLSLLISILYPTREVFLATSYISTEMLY